MCVSCYIFFFKQKAAYEMRISDWSSDVCSSDLLARLDQQVVHGLVAELAVIQTALAGHILEHIAAGIDPARPARLGQLEVAARHGRLQGRELHGPQAYVEARFAAQDRKSTRLNSSH